MKKCIVFMLFIQLTLGACDNDDSEPSNDLLGRWKWLSTCGGIAGCRHSTSTNRMVMTISATSITKRQNTDESSSTYEIQNRTDRDDATIYQVMITSTGKVWSIQVEKDRLVMTDRVFTSTYARIF